ncbi:hypothetical protein BT96DRAFT_846858 [Gymnopus androsaceus JB14]|uniref:Peroxisomal membrane protein PEX14 n=1 Tax=Gymnopus androsaceus JB14 TaxID=1447944 RepID=A0A6A4IKR3_9AGAR|nr:hypothetical protein BT96DRAFT_846858 [Gymnopus androsaceus JB14]
MESNREELIRNAVAFLADANSQASPLAQRIQFLEAKGLTQPEIDQAFRLASNQSAAAVPYRAGYPPAFGAPYPAPNWDWRDYFITAVVSGTVVYGAVSLFKKYLSPHLQPPDTTVYEDDRDALTAQFDAAEALLKEIQSETAAVKQAVEEQKEKVDKTTKDVENVVSEMREAESKARDEMREVRDEINTIRDMLPKMIEKNKEAQTQSLAELQQELKSLKALLLSRGPTMSSAPSPAPMVGRPSIPAWQLAGSNASSNSGAAASFNAPTIPIPSPSPMVNLPAANGKGKERDVSETSITS